MAETSIEWTRGDDGSPGWSINPLRARDPETDRVGHHCEKVSLGCASCYAERLQKRLRGSGKYIRSERDRLEHFLDDSKLQQVLKRRKPTRIFWCDMTDMFGEWVPFEWIDLCFAVMALTPHHTHQLLTKRPDRAAEYLLEIQNDDKDTHRWASFAPEISGSPCADAAVEDRDWPLSNVWIGTSVEDQHSANVRREHLQSCPAAVRFVSYEPALGPVDWTGWKFVDWIISGGESGPKARANHPGWFRATRDFCSRNGIAYFHKQNGAWAPDDGRVLSIPHIDITPDGQLWGGIQVGSQRMIRVGKKAAGRLLDGREHNEFPERA